MTCCHCSYVTHTQTRRHALHWIRTAAGPTDGVLAECLSTFLLSLFNISNMKNQQSVNRPVRSAVMGTECTLHQSVPECSFWQQAEVILNLLSALNEVQKPAQAPCVALVNTSHNKQMMNLDSHHLLALKVPNLFLQSEVGASCAIPHFLLLSFWPTGKKNLLNKCSMVCSKKHL